MMKHEQQTSRLEKSSTFFGGNNFSGLNLYKKGIVDHAVSVRIYQPGVLFMLRM